MTLLILLSLVMIALAPDFSLLMTARALLGLAIGGFWSLATATVIRLVPAEHVPKVLGSIYMGNAIATAFAHRSGPTWENCSAGGSCSAASRRW